MSNTEKTINSIREIKIFQKEQFLLKKMEQFQKFLILAY